MKFQKIISIVALICISSVSFVALGNEPAYTGDGKMIDHGSDASFNRHQLSLAEIDLDKSGTYTYKMAKLPDCSMTIYLVMENLPPLLPNDNLPFKKDLPTVELQLKTKKGDKVLKRKRPLAKWTWSGSMHGTTREIYIRGGKQGETSTFKPIPGTEYELTIKVMPTKQKHNKKATLKVVGGGWKVEGKPMPISFIIKRMF